MFGYCNVETKNRHTSREEAKLFLQSRSKLDEICANFQQSLVHVGGGGVCLQQVWYLGGGSSGFVWIGRAPFSKAAPSSGTPSTSSSLPLISCRGSIYIE